jgi:CRISPR-associated protein Cas2
LLYTASTHKGADMQAEKLYLIAYDITDTKRLAKVRNLIYSYALGGQKSALEVPLTKKALMELLKKLEPLIREKDKVNIIQIDKDTLLFGKADFITYDNGLIII